MKKVRDIMTTRPRCIAPDATLLEAARLMAELDVGSLPVAHLDRLAGMVTDRDLVVRGLARGLDPEQARVSQVMTDGVTFVQEEQEVQEAARLFEAKQIRRLPVLNRQKHLVGIVSLGDLALQAETCLSGEALKEVSEPVHAHLAHTD